MIRTILCLCLIILLAGCGGSMQIEDFADRKPELKIEEYFLGKTRGYGFFEGRGGDLKRSFVVDIVGEIDDEGQLVLTEDFVYADGEISQRIWRIEILGDGQYIGRASDVVGEAIGVSDGNALNWRYLLDQKLDDGTIKLRFNDWMYLQPDGVLLNRAKVTKFGFHVGTVILSFRQLSAEEQFEKLDAADLMAAE